jgi:hypothetical protein
MSRWISGTSFPEYTMRDIKKGDRIRAHWFQTTNASLAGAQPKFGAVEISVEGRVTHIRGDHPTEPTTIRVWIQPDDGPEIDIDPHHITAVLEQT